ncbi:hypothetical protein H2203_008651 [Taxawa tesnikishii (nom. ined.)]|nr:hypothetical protein H2203_008651 [Dothideales sp. JES 119]
MSYSHSRTWRAPQYAERQKWQRVIEERNRLFPNSPFFHPDLDYKTQLTTTKQEKEACLAERAALLEGSYLRTNHSNVLSQQTVWCPQFKHGWQVDQWNLDVPKQFIAPWPSLQEYKYEGDDRVATGLHHGRFLPHPRYPGNETVNWGQIKFLPQYPFDQVGYALTPEEIFFANHEIPEMEVGDEEGEVLIGKELMAALDPQGIFD